MKKSTKLFIILLIVGAVGLAVAVGAVIASGMLFSREASVSYTFDDAPLAVVMDMKQAKIETVPSEDCRVEAYAKAWKTGEIDMKDVLDVRMEGDMLVIKEKSFASDFLGLFPQPYELQITVYAPQTALDAMGGESS